MIQFDNLLGEISSLMVVPLPLCPLQSNMVMVSSKA